MGMRPVSTPNQQLLCPNTWHGRTRRLKLFAPGASGSTGIAQQFPESAP